ncbi:MAG: NUDIX hydrolase [Verrucomicrobia bacterium]|nr:NUDIX hydrolase [Verrucomicrobiota bacterium]
MDVAGCFCVYKGKILFLHRNPDKPQGQTWCVPGGKLEKGETAEQAVIREVMEEVGIDLKGKSLTYCRKVFVRFPDREFTLHLFQVQLDEEPLLKVSAGEHQGYRWVTMEEALKLPLIPGGDQCLKVVFNEKKAEGAPTAKGAAGIMDPSLRETRKQHYHPFISSI